MVKLIALVLVAVVGCGKSNPVASDARIDALVDAPEMVNPRGNWAMTYVYAVDSCGNPGSTMAETMVVTVGAYGGFASTTDLTGAASGSVTITCTTTSCMFTGVLTGTGINKQTDNLTLFANHTISGTGSETVAAPCTATFTASGTL